MAIPAALWPEVSRLLDEALNLDASARAPWLAGLRVQRPDLAVHVERLLAAHDTAFESDPLSGPPSELIASALAQPPGGAQPHLIAGQMLGPYRLVSPLGQGGMAAVWLAEQTVNVLRRVALKLPFTGLEDRAATTARFTQERDFLAGLEHPHIARLYDAGVSESGQPYLAMEWVAGVPITRYADDKRLRVQQRLALFEQVLQAVRHAHARLVIHRDIKPGNILVTPDGDVKLLDFGIARLLGEGLAPGTLASADHAKALTPEAASPEQLAGRPLTIASDVYSLGLVLYELLCGRRPYQFDLVGTERTAPALYAAVMHAQVPPPSSLAFDAERAAACGATPGRLRSQLAGDLDAIVQMALRKDPEQRYASVDELRMDIERHQEQQPVQARPGRWDYVVLRAVQRHRVAVVAGALVLASLIGGSVAVAWQARQARDEARRATAVQGFLLSLFQANTPEIARGQAITARDLLARGAARVDDDLRDQPRALALLHTELGDILSDMGQPTDARQHLDKALQLYRSLGLEASAEGIRALYFHANSLWLRGELDAAQAEYRRCIELGAPLGPRQPLALKIRQRLAFVLYQRGELAEALAMARAGLAQPVGRDAAQDQAQRLTLRHVVALVQAEQGQFDQAVQTQRQLVEEAQTAPAVSVEARFNYRHVLARTLFQRGDFEQALRQCEDMMPELTKVFGPRADLTIHVRQIMIHSLAGLGRYGPALELAQENLAYRMESGANDEESVAIDRSVVASLLVRAFRFDEGIAMLRDVVAVVERHHDKPTLDLEFFRRQLGYAMTAQGNIAGGTRLIELARDNLRAIPGIEKMPDWAATLDTLATARRLGGDVEGSLGLLDQACALYAATPGRGSVFYLRCAAERAWLAAWRSPADPVARDQFDQAATEYAQRFDKGHPVRADLALMRVELAARAGRSEPMARKEALIQWQRTMGRDWPGHLIALH
jgi:serine/threonine protein kinase